MTDKQYESLVLKAEQEEWLDAINAGHGVVTTPSFFDPALFERIKRIYSEGESVKVKALRRSSGHPMPPVTNEMVYAALKIAVERGLLPKGASQDKAVENFNSIKAIWQAASEAGESTLKDRVLPVDGHKVEICQEFKIKVVF